MIFLKKERNDNKSDSVFTSIIIISDRLERARRMDWPIELGLLSHCPEKEREKANVSRNINRFVQTWSIDDDTRSALIRASGNNASGRAKNPAI